MKINQRKTSSTQTSPQKETSQANNKTLASIFGTLLSSQVSDTHHHTTSAMLRGNRSNLTHPPPTPPPPPPRGPPQTPTPPPPPIQIAFSSCDDGDLHQPEPCGQPFKLTSAGQARQIVARRSGERRFVRGWLCGPRRRLAGI